MEQLYAWKFLSSHLARHSLICGRDSREAVLDTGKLLSIQCFHNLAKSIVHRIQDVVPALQAPLRARIWRTNVCDSSMPRHS
jgi:hypothetical protein